MALQTYTAVHDFHIFAVDKTNRLGANAWLTSAIVSLEFILVVKHIHERGMFESYLPAPYIVNCWMAFFAILLLLMLFKCLRMVYLWAWSSSEVGGENEHRQELLQLDEKCLRKIENVPSSLGMPFSTAGLRFSR